MSLVLPLETLARQLGKPSSGDGRPSTRAEWSPASASIDPMVSPPRALPTILAMPLDEFARDGPLIEIRVPWHAETLWFVPDERDAAALVSEGVYRGRVWTATELIVVMAVPGRTPAVVQPLALAKLAIDGHVVAVGPRADIGTRPAREERS